MSKTAEHALPSLVTLLSQRVTMVTFVAVGTLTTALLFLLHYSIHEQTDALLLRLAKEDALSSHHNPGGAHLHDTSIATPTLQATVVDKYAMILGEDCEILDRTSNLPNPTFPPSICPEQHSPGTRSLLFMQQLADVPLRVAIVYDHDAAGKPAAFVVGISHHDVDASTWRSTGVAIPLALLAALLIVGALRLAIRPPVRELEKLSEAVGLLERRDPLGSLALASTAIKQTPHTSAEIALLSGAIHDAFDELQRAGERRARFIAEASHELRTPITALRGELEVTLRRDRENDAYKDALEASLQSALRLQSLAEHLLEISGHEEQEATLGPVDLRAIVDEAIHLRADRAENKGIDILWQPPEAPIWALADQAFAFRALGNLIDNAMQHADAEQLHIRLVPDDHHVRILVQDDGKGIDKDAMVVLFEPFGKSIESEGHGLGLYLVRTLMRAQQGDVLWTNDDSKQPGAHFELRFQRADQP